MFSQTCKADNVQQTLLQNPDAVGSKSDPRTCSSRETAIPICEPQILVFIQLPTDVEFVFWKSNDIYIKKKWIKTVLQPKEGALLF